MTYGVFREIERLMENIPINTSTYGIGELGPNTSIDSRFYFRDIDGVATRLGILEAGRNSVSMRDVIKLLNKFLKNSEIEELVENPTRYRESQRNNSGAPLKSLLFDFCLSALTGDIFDAKLYLTHSLHLVGLRRHLVLLLSSIVSEPTLVNDDKDVRKLLTLLAIISEPNNIDIYFDIEEGGFNERYITYLQEMNKLSQDNKKNEELNILKLNQVK